MYLYIYIYIYTFKPDTICSDPMVSGRHPEEGCISCKRKLNLYNKSLNSSKQAFSVDNMRSRERSINRILESSESPLSSLYINHICVCIDIKI